MRVCIEKMESKHVDEVVEIEKVSFSSPWTRAMYTQETDLEYSNCFVIIVDEELTAYISSWTVLDECTINKIACRSDLRRRGYSTMLLNHLIQKVCGNSVKDILIEVRESNDTARAFYKKSGFIIKGLRKGYYSDTKEDAILMSLDVGKFLAVSNVR
jgi:[ribosomal protein S18]-alanine N-acetyltransferase